jgi:hypothetical protein
MYALTTVLDVEYVGYELLGHLLEGVDRHLFVKRSLCARRTGSVRAVRTHKARGLHCEKGNATFCNLLDNCFSSAHYGNLMRDLVDRR